MGFASMFEELREKTVFEFRHVSLRMENLETKREDAQPIEDVQQTDVMIPKRFSEQAQSILQADNVPSYLVDRYVNWLYELQAGRKSMDAIWVEFVREALPLLTQHLSDSDPVTHEFVRKLCY